MENNEKENTCSDINRRDFIKLIGGAAAGAAITAAVSGCGGSPNEHSRARGVPTDKMTYRKDKNGNSLSLLGYGMMRLPVVQRRRGESRPDTNDIDQEAVNELVDYAIAHGVNVFDTAPVYSKGFSEKATGEALSRHPRDKYFVATKMSNFRQQHRSREDSIRMYYQSFENLKVDYIDHYFVHNIGTHQAWRDRFLDNGIYEFLLKEKEAGRIKQLGWSFHGDGDFFEWMANEYPWDFVMIQHNYLDYRNIMGWTNINSRRQYEILAEKNIPVWAMEPLLGGGLANPHYKVRELMTQMKPDVTPASWAMRFAGSFPKVVTALSGMTFMEHLQDNIISYSPLEEMNAAENKLLENVNDIMLRYRNILCTRCQYCMPCPYGIDIPEIFTQYNRSMNEGNYPVNPDSESFKRARRAFLVGMDRSVSPARQASRCISCRKCVSTCPQRINIPQELRRIDAFIEELRTGGQA